MKAEPLLYGPGTGLLTDNPWPALATALQNVFVYSCKLQKEKHDDITLREALVTVGWPAAADLTPAQLAAEFFIADFDYEYPPEQISLFSFADDKGSIEWVFKEY